MLNCILLFKYTKKYPSYTYAPLILYIAHVYINTDAVYIPYSLFVASDYTVNSKANFG